MRKAGMIVALIAAVLAVSGPASGSPQYPYPHAPNCPEEACTGDKWGFYQGQCTSGVAWKLNERNGVSFHAFGYAGVGNWGNAANWKDAARSAGFRVDESPATGAVAWYGVGRFGHVAYVEDVNPDGSIVLWEMNFDGDNGVRQHVVHPGEAVGRIGGWPDKFIHIDDLEQADDTPDGSYVGTMVRNRDTGAVYLVKADGERYWVPSGGDYTAMRNNGIPMRNLSPAQIEQIPDSGRRASVQRQDEPHVTGPAHWIIHRNSTPHGFAGDYELTQSAAGNSQTTNAAIWTHDVAPDGVYRVKAFIPKREAVADVVYEVFDGDHLVERVPMDQRQHYGFTTLVERHFDSGEIRIRLRDNAGDGPYGAHMGYDVTEAVPIR
jgi:surface antigen